MRAQRIIMIIGLFFFSYSLSVQCQDTIRYEGFLGILLKESIELYPNNQFKWTSEYDLSWSEFGIYENKEKELTLKFYKSLSGLSENEIQKPYKIEVLIIESNQLFRLNKKGKKIKRIRDKSFKYKWSWLFGHKYKIVRRND